MLPLSDANLICAELRALIGSLSREPEVLPDRCYDLFFKRMAPFATESKVYKCLGDLYDVSSKAGHKEVSDKVNQLLDMNLCAADRGMIDQINKGVWVGHLGLTSESLLLNFLDIHGSKITCLTVSIAAYFSVPVRNIAALLDRCPNITALHAKNSFICPDIVEQITEHPHAKGLKELNLSYCRVGPLEGVKIATALKKLEILDLSWTDLCAVYEEGTKDLRGLHAISCMENLEILNISSPKVLEGDMAVLSNMKKLVGLDVRRSHISAEDLEAFTDPEKTPDLRVLFLPRKFFSPHLDESTRSALSKLKERGVKLTTG
jgi:hypothetical protein